MCVQTPYYHNIDKLATKCQQELPSSIHSILNVKVINSLTTLIDHSTHPVFQRVPPSDQALTHTDTLAAPAGGRGEQPQLS